MCILRSILPSIRSYLLTSKRVRQYEPIWLRIKQNKTASIATHPKNVARVIKAVNKEKNIDTGYKLLLAEQAHKAILYTTRRKNSKDSGKMVTIKFSLKITLNENYIGMNTL